MQNRLSFSAALVAVMLVSEVQAQDQAGSVIFSRGPVNAQRTQLVPLMKGDGILVDDVIVTGLTGRAQIELLDGAKIAIRPDSRLAIEEFMYVEPTVQPAAPAAQSSSDRSVMNLLKGGFRTITGIIGETDEEAYEVRTPVGSLGIRGTDYAALYCLSDCLFAPGVVPGQPPEDGLYISVTTGIVAFSNELIEIEIEAGQFVFIPLIDRLPQLLDVPPPVLLDEFDVALIDPAGGAQSPDPRLRGFGAPAFAARTAAPSGALAAGRGTGSTDPGSSVPGTGGQAGSVPAQLILAVDIDGVSVNLTAGVPAPPTNRTVNYVTGPLGPAPATPFGGTLDNLPAQYTLDGGNNLTGFAGPYASRTAPMTVAQFDIGTAGNVDVGFDSVTMLRWGRWTGGTVAITLLGGGDASQDMGNQSLHWISGPQSAPPVMPTMGSANYSLVGGTSPTDNFGNTGIIGDASFVADFTNMMVTSSLDLSIAGSQWTANGNGQIGGTNPPMPANFFGGAYSMVAIDGVASGSGFFNGFFSEPGSTDPNLPGGAGLNFALQDMNQTTQISGALIFGNPN